MTVARELSFNLDGNISSMGLPVNGATIRLYDYWHRNGFLIKHFLCEQVTTNRGIFSFNVRKGIYSIEILPHENTRFTRQSLEAIRVTGNKNLNIVLKAGVILSGKVMDSTGAPVTNAELLVFGIEPHVLRTSQKLDENGAYNLTLPQGKYYLALRHVELELANLKKKKNLSFLCPLFDVVELYGDSSHDITLPPLINFKGKVTDMAGHPMFGVRAIVTRADLPENIFAKEVAVDVSSVSRLDGQFECLVQAGRYSVHLLPPEDSHLAEKTVYGLSVDKDCQHNYTLEPGHILRGLVMHKGKPVPNATVNAIGMNWDSICLTNDEGEYSFLLPGGTYEITAADQPDSLGAVTAMELAPCSNNIFLDHDNEKYDIEMEEGVLITGTVQDASSQFCPGVQLSLYATIDGEFNAAAACRRPLWVGISGDDGTYEFRLVPGKYWLVLNNQSSTGHLVEVEGTKQKSNLTINDICIVNVEVLSENDEPIPNCQICAEPYGIIKSTDNTRNFGEVMLPMFTDNTGKCTLALPQGIYSIYLHPPEHSSYADRHIRQLSINADMSRKIRLDIKTNRE